MIKQAMEDGYGDEQQELPPGFRFHPTDEELVTYYLSRKAADHGFSGAGVIGEVDLNKCEPWDLPRRGAKMGEKEWYFFCVRDRKYPVGLRTNRATDAGYWKATGKDKEVRRGKSLVGMKKTLVFYRGRAPKGDKTSWVMHEYRLDDNFYLCNLPSKAAKNEWVICRVFQKSSSSSFAGGDEKNLPPATAAVIKVPCVARMGSSFHRDDATIGTGPLLPPLMGFPSRGSKMAGTAPITSGANHVTCFSSAAAGYTSYEELLMGSCHSSSSLFSASSSVLPLAKHPEEAAGRMQLLERGGSVAKEAGLASDINPEISSSLLLLLSEGTEVISSQIKVPSVPSGNIMPLGDCMWNY